MVEHNVPFAVADHFSPLLKECFKDSPTAQNYKCARTKTSCIINEAVAPHFRKELVMKMRTNPFTLITDGSNDTGREKMNPLTVRVYDSYSSKVVHRFLDMCPTSGPSCGTAEVIYQKMDEALQKSHTMEKLILKEHGSIYIHGCPCHIIHNTAKQAGLGFLEVCGFDPEDLTVDVGYWFKGSTNRKGYLTDEKQPGCRRLLEAFSNPMTEVYLLFYQATLPVFSTFNLLLQREKSSIFLLHDEIRSFIREKLVIGFTTRATLNRLLDAGDITPQQVQRFQQAAVAFLVRAVEYAMKKLPMREPLIKHAMFLEGQQRVEGGVEDALYFVDRFPELLPYNGPDERDKLSEEFLDYQSMDIAMPEDPATFDIESFWGNMASMKNKVTGMSRFGRLSRIAKLVLVLPHSDADAERVFSSTGGACEAKEPTIEALRPEMYKAKAHTRLILD
ncbi:Light-independent protochlorophyllide reductase subunit B [Dissostichus eleginoides]|uniref:Light-independent protochlorophyllide reductase subunit B n=1 Tax=Dissostichus eleginoides TaxID=100907 RepID=A0AAD9CLE5_DISEL|nr:Light-independent protochlorophyllide reductase subunit B [Dissostichus eleginoides]